MTLRRAREQGVRGAVLALAAACASGAGLSGACLDPVSTYQPDGGPTDFTIGGTAFRDASGTVQVTGSTLTFWLTNQPDACCAVLNVPQTPLVVLKLQVAPPADGSTSVVIVSKSAPGAGEAVGALTSSLVGRVSGSHAAVDGKLAWSLGSDGYYTISKLEVGFADTTDRLVLPAPVVVPACTGCASP